MVSSTLLLALSPLALAQYNHGPANSSSAAGAAAATTASSPNSAVQTVTVGQNGLVFSPAGLTVASGKQVVFEFFPGQHSVVQANFNSPCASNGGFYSGVIDSQSGPATNTFTVTVNGTQPIWFYCGHPGHCEAGMVGAINAPSSGNTLAAFKAAAQKASPSASPSSVQGGSVGPAPSSSGSASGSASASTPSSVAAGLSVVQGGALVGAVAVAMALM